MKKSLLVLLISAVFLMAYNQNVSAAVIGSFSQREWYPSIFNDGADSVRLEASFHSRYMIPHDTLPPPNEWPEWVPLIDLTLDAGQVGTSWTYDSESQGFTKNIEILTNGIQDFFAYMNHDNGYGFFAERALWDNYMGYNGFDFESYKIEEITFTLDQFSPFDYPGAIYYTVAVHGEQVPVPDTVFLLFSGIAGFAGFRRLKNR